MIVSLSSETTAVDSWPCNLNIASITLISVEVVSWPQNAVQSLTTKPAPKTSAPLLTVPAAKGTCNKEDNSSWSWIEVLGWTNPPWFDKEQ